MEDEHLAVAVRAGADADGRDLQLGGDLRGEVERDALEDHGEGAGLLHRTRVVEHALALAGAVTVAASLHAVAAHAMDRLRCEPDVAHDRDVDHRDRLDRARHREAPLQLDGLAIRLLEEPAGRAEGLPR